jgi:acyl-CoA oxidase
VLDRLLALHGLALLDQDQAWFLRHGLFEPGRARAVRRELAAVCLELRPDAVSIVAGFALPPEVLGAPIAQTQ